MDFLHSVILSTSTNVKKTLSWLRGPAGLVFAKDDSPDISQDF